MTDMGADMGADMAVRLGVYGADMGRIWGGYGAVYDVDGHSVISMYMGGRWEAMGECMRYGHFSRLGPKREV